MRIDLETFQKVYASSLFPAECRSKVVVDVGAHKGYFALWALGRSAASVVSFEPQSQNFEYLAQAQRTHRRSGDWEIRHSAIGRAEGHARLYVSQESWAHSMYSELADSADFEDVPVTTLGRVLGDIRERWPTNRVAIKVNVEGAVADVLLSANNRDYETVDTVLFDHEPGSPYSVEELLAYLIGVGLSSVDVSQGRYYILTRDSSTGTR